MGNLFTDYEVLSGYVDKLIAAKYPDRDKSTLQDLKNKTIIELDHQIVHDVFAKLPLSQVEDIKARMGRGEEIDFTAEFSKAENLKLEDTMTETIKKYTEEFLGGQNA